MTSDYTTVRGNVLEPDDHLRILLVPPCVPERVRFVYWVNAVTATRLWREADLYRQEFMRRLNGIFVLSAEAYGLVYGQSGAATIRELIGVNIEPQTAESIARYPELLAEVDVLMGGWGMPKLTPSLLDHAPRLQALFYAGGSLASVLTPAVWDRGLVMTTAIEANAIPVAEYTLGVILLSLKHMWKLSRQTHAAKAFVERNQMPGIYKSTVGLISFGATARAVARLLRPFELRVLVCDPFISHAEADAAGVELVSLDALFARSDVVSLHAPLLAETQNMISGELFSQMKDGATFINTARGKIVEHNGLIENARLRPDLTFVLDVTEPEPPATDSPLYRLPNIVLSPHIAGSSGGECRRLGQYMIEELERYIIGAPLKWQVTPESVAFSSHQPLAITRELREAAVST